MSAQGAVPGLPVPACPSAEDPCGERGLPGFMKLVRPPFLSYSSPLFASQLSCLGISASLFLFFLYLFLPLPLTPSIFLFPFLWLLTDLLAERPCSVGPGRAPLLLWLHQESEVRGNCPDAAQAPGFFPGSEARRGNSPWELPLGSPRTPARLPAWSRLLGGRPGVRPPPRQCEPSFRSGARLHPRDRSPNSGRTSEN